MPEDDSRERADALWDEYGRYMARWDDITLARWIAQTLSQLSGEIWRQSHPLIGAFRLGAMQAWKRGLMLHRHVTIPQGYLPAECCGSPLLPMVTRDVLDQGLLCMFCHGKALALDELEREYQDLLIPWAKRYAIEHDVAHWPDDRRKPQKAYEAKFEQAAENAERLLMQLATEILPHLQDRFPAIVWEDQDECLDVRPDDLLSGGPEASSLD